MFLPLRDVDASRTIDLTPRVYLRRQPFGMFVVTMIGYFCPFAGRPRGDDERVGARLTRWNCCSEDSRDENSGGSVGSRAVAESTGL